MFALVKNLNVSEDIVIVLTVVKHVEKIVDVLIVKIKYQINRK
jgi:hypothetical protein